MRRHATEGAVFTVDWSEVEACNLVQPCVHSWVSDESIAYALEHLVFDDPAIPHHSGTHRANRIASIIRMMEAGVEFDPIKIALTSDGIHIHDGHHRLRSYQYRRRLDRVPIYIGLQS